MRQDLKARMAAELPHIRRFAYTLTNDPDSADDLAQASVERALRKRLLWRGKGTLRSWMFRIVYTTYLNRRARQGLPTRPLAPDDISDAQQAPRQDAIMTCLNIGAAMKLLPPGQKEALALIALEGLSYEDAAAVLDVPVGTVRSRVSRAREALRPMLAPAKAGRQRPDGVTGVGS